MRPPSPERGPDQSPPPACPTEADLAAAVAGSMLPPRAEALGRHIEGCPACQARLDAISGLPEIAAAIAGKDTEIPLALRQVIARLRSADPNAADSPGTEVDGETLDFLTPSSRPGSLGRFAGYDILGKVAAGGMGLVLKAHDDTLDRVVAIKVLSPVLAASSPARARFVREARAAAAVVHEHVVSVHAVGEEAGLPYIVMQFVNGQSLEGRLRAGPLPLDALLRIGCQTALGLAAAHAQGLVHRDVKPANILLENGVERVKLTDFGLARSIDATDVSRPGVIAGTPEFMSPEQARGETVGPRSDLFSLGAILYLAATGRSPFHAEGALAVMRQVCELSPTRVDVLNPDRPAWLGDIIQHLLEKSASDRFESADSVATVLGEALAQLQAGTNPRRIQVTVHARPRRTQLALSAGILLMALAAGGVWWSRAHRAPIPSPSPAAHSHAAHAFQLHRAGGGRSGFTNLAESIAAAASGDRIELAFDGELATPSVEIRSKRLTLASANGFRPVLVHSESRGTLLSTDAPLVLEGLELRARKADSDNTLVGNPGLRVRQLGGRRLLSAIDTPLTSALVVARDAPVTAVGCRFVTCALPDLDGDCVILGGHSRGRFLNCEFYDLGGTCIWWRTDSRSKGASTTPVVLANNCILVGSQPFTMTGPGGLAGEFQIERSTLVGMLLFTIPMPSTLQLNLDQSVVVSRFLFGDGTHHGVPAGVRWNERSNLFVALPLGNRPPMPPARGPTSVEGREVFETRMRFLGGSPHRLVPADFALNIARTLASSSLDRARLDSLGIDASKVGPGEPYERWRSTPEALRWLTGYAESTTPR